MHLKKVSLPLLQDHLKHKVRIQEAFYVSISELMALFCYVAYPKYQQQVLFNLL